MSHRVGSHLVARKFVSFLAVAPVLLLNYLITVRVTSSIIQYVNPILQSSDLQALRHLEIQPVILSVAKDLCIRRARSFATLKMTAGHLSRSLTESLVYTTPQAQAMDQRKQ